MVTTLKNFDINFVDDCLISFKDKAEYKILFDLLSYSTFNELNVYFTNGLQMYGDSITLNCNKEYLLSYNNRFIGLFGDRNLKGIKCVYICK